ENTGRQRSASSAGATRKSVPLSERSWSRRSAWADVLVASVIRSSFQSDKAERAVEAIEPASRSGVKAKATRRSEAFASSTTFAKPRYSDTAVRVESREQRSHISSALPFAYGQPGEQAWHDDRRRLD